MKTILLTMVSSDDYDLFYCNEEPYWNRHIDIPDIFGFISGKEGKIVFRHYYVNWREMEKRPRVYEYIFSKNPPQLIHIAQYLNSNLFYKYEE